MRRWPAVLLALACGLARAQWQFGEPLDVIPATPGAFPHLDASGRKALAVSGGVIALAWEDSRSGQPTCRLAVKGRQDPAFREFTFGRGECFEPALTALPGERFALIWEDETGVAAATAGPTGIGPALALTSAGGQGSLAWHPGCGLYAAWSSPEGRWRRVWRAQLTLGPDGRLGASAVQPADAAPPVDDQLYPVLAATASTVALAWEDRRLGHTVIYGSSTRDGRSWTPPLRISHNPTGRVQGELGRGTGAMRPTLSALGGERLAAVWLDKRDFLGGYDVYAALSQDGGGSWGPDRLAQDSFGEATAQWHAAAAGSASGELAIAWDDARDGTPDVWLTWLEADGGFAENVSPAAGPGSQTDPVLALDETGNLHLAWIERTAEELSRLRYAVGRPSR